MKEIVTKFGSVEVGDGGSLIIKRCRNKKITTKNFIST